LGQLNSFNEFYIPSVSQAHTRSVFAWPLHTCSSGNKFFSISDDRVNGRFYVLQLDVEDKKKNSGLTATITDVVTMLDINGNTYAANSIDPESIRYDRNSDTLFWSTEGDANALIPPLITEMATTGKYIGTVPFSKRFAVSDSQNLTNAFTAAASQAVYVISMALTIYLAHEMLANLSTHQAVDVVHR
jgi:hypothetical protein